MLQQLRAATLLLLWLTLLTGGVYPLLVTFVAQAAFPHEAGGSLIVENGKIAGSELLGQPFTKPEFFWGRLSATSLHPYNAAASGGSNLGLMNPALLAAAQARTNALRTGNASPLPVPVDLITSSGSGLDPHISPAAAEFQILRVAAARSMPEEELLEIVRRHTEGRQFGVLGEPRVNVLRLNRELAAGSRNHDNANTL